MKNDKLKSSKLGRPITCGICKTKFHKKSDKERKIWRENKLECPSCGAKYSCLPKQERQLMILQDEYFDKKDNNLIGEMYKILYPYAKSLAYKKFRGVMNDEYHEEFAHEASILLLQGYYKYADSFRITTSFGGYLQHRFLQIPIDEMKTEVSLNDLNDDNKEYFQLESPIDLAKDDELTLKRSILLEDMLSFMKSYRPQLPQIKMYSLLNFLYSLQNNSNVVMIPAKNKLFLESYDAFTNKIKKILVDNDKQ
jgi:hypothetical protein